MDVPSDYARYLPTLAEYAGLPGDDPRRAGLRSTLILAFLPVVQHIARRYGDDAAQEDLTQAGVIGLIHAVDHWDPGSARGDALGYVVPCVRGEILRHLRDRTWSVRVSRPVKELVVSLDKAVGPLTQRLGRAPRPSELAEQLGVGVDEVIDALAVRAERRSASLDASIEPGEPPLAERLGDADPDLDEVDLRRSVWPLLAELPDRERRIVLLRFFGNKTQSEIGELVGLSQMHVSRLLARALATLRHGLLS
ncbi:sigma-70 family RNA polymerase sigma factor [Pseudonocardia kujensis]|uniref:sigma-70 family RNA polymerase sigma factor n=1 Tax=Pseudonocardia kujensis TaxID=1128675 RepID=UPI001E4D0C30|nr:sigma-70 family RNA polymerase sigma factor [Pseudonocardia kujensis]MCE0763805.1 sigma-70 family RNA polymerase sigma factor [Pseudonocardia kujensis]